MESVGPDGKNNPFSRSNKPRSEFPTLFLLNLFADVRQDLRYGDGRSRCENRPIFKENYPNFKVKQAPQQLFDVIFLKIFCGRSSRPLLWSRLVSIGKLVQFKVKQTLESISDVIFANFFLWTSVKTLTMEPVGPDWKTSPFSRSNDPRIHGSFGDKDFRHHFCRSFLWTSIKTLTMELDGPDGKTVSFSNPWIFWISRFPMSFLSKFFVDARPSLWSQLVPMGKPAHFQGQTNPVSDNHLILPIFVCYSPWIFW
ncbi:hypothetical protein H5410_056591 [Solanum commersonii]|uniref:Uncharacterized protein n=1 Tax=Solanum commersonii TaxID=4109 RepID=A0A9J5WKM5_SOLCO|nr:hypothetical protein H5410_056591 [Solanum commersonii]